jgi:hypothetical protein
MPIKHPLPIKTQKSNSPITDVVHFFAHTTDAYLQFEQKIAGLISILPSLLPQQLADECNQLRDQKAQLEILDQQMFEILDLAGDQIAQDSMIQDYQVALARANMASYVLYEKLQVVKKILQEGNAEVAEKDKPLST